MMAPFYSIHPHPESQSSGSRGVSRVVQCTYRVDDSLETLWIVFARRPPGPARWLSVAGPRHGPSHFPHFLVRQWMLHGGGGESGGESKRDRRNNHRRRGDYVGGGTQSRGG